MCSVVIADDEYLEREVIKKIVSGIEGAKVVGEGNSGRKAIELCSALKPELVILNREMGGIDGMEASREIRKHNKDIVIIMTSSLDKQPDKNVINFMDINEFLLKPIRPSKIEEVIRKYAHSSKDSDNTEDVSNAKKALQYYPAHLISKEITAALAFINNHYRENISLDIVAKEVFLSRYYFSRLFKKEVGVTFSSYVLHVKMNEAKRLLDTTNKSILDISTHLNFKEQNYFCRVFKNHTGLTPTEYRNRSFATSLERKKIVDTYLS